jgi:hypothetical protein
MARLASGASVDCVTNLSWRVLLLPLLGEKELFERFRMGEPWDSEHNRKLIPLMPKIYRAPGSKAGEGRTNYLGAIGPNAAFPQESAIMVPDFEQHHHAC